MASSWLTSDMGRVSLCTVVRQVFRGRDTIAAIDLRDSGVMTIESMAPAACIMPTEAGMKETGLKNSGTGLIGTILAALATAKVCIFCRLSLIHI